jgi:hypothetical protein
LLSAENTFCTADGRVVWSTFVRYNGLLGRLVWPPLALVHRALVALLLRRAASQG